MRRAVREWVWASAGWTALALFFSISSALTYTATGRAANWSVTIPRALAEWWLWAVLTPPVAWLARRFPLRPREWRRPAAIHLGAGIAIAIAKTAADRAIFAWLTGFWLYWLASSFALQFFVYAALVAATHGLGYYRRSREREQLEARLAEARLQLLNMQLQPHFLFNTLNAIAELVHEDADAADRMITGLSGLLRRSLDLGSTQHIPLALELELLAAYVDIQKARFGDRLQVRVDADEAARAATVPVLLLQPVVENAIRHGVAAQLAAGRVDIRARRDGSSLVVIVTDDGRGVMDEDRGRTGFGLGNTHARLEALYGPVFSLSLENMPARGARVTIRLPYRPAAAV